MTHLLTSGLVGLILGSSWSPTPRRFKELSALIRLPVVVLAGLLGSLTVLFFGIPTETSGIDYLELIVGAVMSFVVALAAVGVVSNLRSAQ